MTDNGYLWIELIRHIVRIVGPEFTLRDVYAYRPVFERLFPGNHHIEEKCRQQLQVLRDEGELEFLGDGAYRQLRPTSHETYL